MQIRAVNTLLDFESLRSDWDRLLHASEHASVFSSWEWQFSWWKHYGEAHLLRILVVEQESTIVAIAPLFIRKKSVLGLYTLKQLQYIGSGGDTSPEYLTMLSDTAHEKHTSKALAQFISDWKEWDMIDWSDVSSHCPLTATLAYDANNGTSMETGVCSEISRVQLPDSWEELLQRFERKKRHKIRKGMERAGSQSNRRFFTWEDGDTLDKAMDSLVSLHHKRWDSQAKHCAFSTKQYISFHQDVMRAFHERGWLRLYCLANDDHMIAMDYCYRFRGVVMQFQRGFDPAYKDIGPGFALMNHSMQCAIEEGSEVFDFLKGDYAHKKRFETGTTQTLYLRGYRSNAPALLYRWLKSTRACVRSILKGNTGFSQPLDVKGLQVAADK